MMKLTITNSMRQIVCILLSSLAMASAADTASTSRESSKPFYLRDIEVGGTTLPFSPATVVVMIVSAFMLGGIFNSPKSTATASHILVEGPDSEKRLEKLKKDIGSDYSKFQACAKLHSKCPSGKSAGGKLGTFKPGMMVPPFDKAIFAKENKVGCVIGPVQTNFGWHLIWVEERNLVE